MTYVAVKGGERAIANAKPCCTRCAAAIPATPDLTVEQIQASLRLAVDRVMCEGSLYDRPLAALAIKQAWGDLVEAVFLARAFRTTLPRLYDTLPIETSQMETRVRRISAIFKDIPGGQIIGPSFDYTQRLLDFSLLAGNGKLPHVLDDAEIGPIPGVIDLLRSEGPDRARRMRSAGGGHRLRPATRCAFPPSAPASAGAGARR